MRDIRISLLTCICACLTSPPTEFRIIAPPEAMSRCDGISNKEACKKLTDAITEQFRLWMVANTATAELSTQAQFAIQVERYEILEKIDEYQVVVNCSIHIDERDQANQPLAKMLEEKAKSDVIYCGYGTTAELVRRLEIDARRYCSLSMFPDVYVKEMLNSVRSDDDASRKKKEVSVVLSKNAEYGLNFLRYCADVCNEYGLSEKREEIKNKIAEIEECDVLTRLAKLKKLGGLVGCDVLKLLKKKEKDFCEDKILLEGYTKKGGQNCRIADYTRIRLWLMIINQNTKYHEI